MKHLESRHLVCSVSRQFTAQNLSATCWDSSCAWWRLKVTRRCFSYMTCAISTKLQGTNCTHYRNKYSDLHTIFNLHRYNSYCDWLISYHVTFLLNSAITWTIWSRRSVSSTHNCANYWGNLSMLSLKSERRSSILSRYDFFFFQDLNSLSSLLLAVQLLPSATKLRRLCFYRCVSVHKGGVVSQHALQQVSRGGWYPNMPCRWYPSMPCSRSRRGGACSQGVPALGGYLLRGGGMCGGDPPASRRLLLRTVRILLECILVLEINSSQAICSFLCH